MEQATRIGYGGRIRYRIVTLKGVSFFIVWRCLFFGSENTIQIGFLCPLGELIESSGTMTGGGHGCARGRMGRNVRTDTSGNETSAKDIALMEAKMQQLTEECSQLRQKRQNLEDELVDLNKLTREGTTNLQKWKMEIRVRQSKEVVLQTGLLE